MLSQVCLKPILRRMRPTLRTDRPKSLDIMKGIQALVVRNRTQVTRNLIQNAPDLCLIGRLGVGLDNIELEACAKGGI